jgi:hypothetical protein
MLRWLQNAVLTQTLATFLGGPSPFAWARASVMRSSTALLIHIQRHQAVGDKPKHLGQYLMIRGV